jgi:isoquinoline 1-oxidoreductase beta subunit
MLLHAAAAEWNVPITTLTVKDSIISHTASNRTATFAALAAGAAKVSMPDNPVLKPRSAFTIMGTSPKRFDIPSKVNGTAAYGIDVKLPGMKYATIKAAPVFGAKVKSLDAATIEKMPGVLKVVNLGNAVAVVADGYWQAKQALEKLPVQFTESGHENVQQEGIFAQFAHDLDAATAHDKNKTDKKVGSAEKMMAEASQVVDAEYRIPYLAHATMEPMNCTAWVHDNQCELWTGSQNPLGFANDVAELLEMDIVNVKIHNQLLGGGFGRRSETDVARQAAFIAREVNYPVKLIWSREEDIQQDYYREANISRLKAGLDKDGKPIAWMHQFLYKHHPAEAPYISYAIDNQLVQYTDSKTHVRWGNWRSVDHSMHGFFIESFIDEMAFAAKKDPCDYRYNLLEHAPGFRKVLELVKEKSGWGTKLPENWGRGIAIYASFGTIVGEVAEVEVSAEGKVRVHRVVCVADAGFAMHPDGFKAQMEGGIVYGLTAALTGEITIKNGAVQQSNFHNYPVMRMNEMPVIETYILNSDNAPGGAGEPSTPVIAAALTNAIFNATGIRVRQLPVQQYDLKRDKWKKDTLG